VLLRPFFACIPVYGVGKRLEAAPSNSTSGPPPAYDRLVVGIQESLVRSSLFRVPILPLIAVAAALLALHLPGGAVGAELSAADIIGKSAARRTVTNSEQTMVMEIFDKMGRSRVRKIVSRVKDSDGVSKSHVEFVEPEDVNGVQFLTVQNPNGEDFQWLYMPASGVLNQISGSSRRGSFMGSDFSFEDLTVGQVGDGDHSLLTASSIEVEGKPVEVHVVQSIPKAALKSAYTRIVTYIEKARLMPRKGEFFGKKGVHVKTMPILEVQDKGGVFVPMRTRMENLKRGTKTEVRVEAVEVNLPPEKLPDYLFTPESLQSEG